VEIKSIGDREKQLGSDQSISDRYRSFSQAGCKFDEGGHVSIGTR